MQKVIDEKRPINDYIDNILERDDMDGFTDFDLFEADSVKSPIKLRRSNPLLNPVNPQTQSNINKSGAGQAK